MPSISVTNSESISAIDQDNGMWGCGYNGQWNLGLNHTHASITILAKLSIS
jgi:hypothetical protein